jgi:hypothetical protein
MNIIKRKTPEEIEAEVSALLLIKPNVPQYSIYGDDNWTAIDAQYIVLMSGMTISDVAHQCWNEYMEGAAFEAVSWMEGTGVYPESPSEGWDAIVKK